MTRGSVESLLQGISDRQAKVGDFLSEKDDKNPITGARESVPPYLDRVKRNEDFKNLLAFLYQEVKNFPTYPHLQEEALKRIHDRVLDRMVTLMENLEAIKEAGLPDAAGMAREEREIQSEYIFLSFIYAGRVADIDDIKAEMADYATMAAAAADTPLDFDPIDVVDPSVAFGPPIPFEPVGPPPGAPPVGTSPDADPAKDKEPRVLPNDFFVFLKENGVHQDLLFGEPKDGENPKEFFEKKYKLLGDIYISILLGKAFDAIDQKISRLDAPNIAKFPVGNFPNRISHTSYSDATVLLYNAAYGLEGARSREKPYALDLIGKLDKVFAVLTGIRTVSDKYQASMASFDGLATYSTPLPTGKDGNEKVPTFFDHEFFSSFLELSNEDWKKFTGSADEFSEPVGVEFSGALNETHFMYRVSPTDPLYDEANPETHWRRVRASMGDQLLQAHHLLKETTRFPHQRGFTNLRRQKVPQALSGYPESIRSGTKYLKTRERGVSEYKAKTITIDVSNGSDSAFPFLAEQPENKSRRIYKFKNVARQVAGGVDDEYKSAAFMSIYASNLIHSWLRADAHGAQLSHKDLWENPELYGLTDASEITEQHVKDFFTVRGFSVDLGPGGVGLEGYTESFVISNLTRAEVWGYKNKLKVRTLGVTAAERALNMQNYAEKTVGGPESREGYFQQKVIGMVKTLVLPFDEYFVDWESGYTVGELLEELTRPENSNPLLGSRQQISARIARAIGADPSQNWALHLKDSFYLTKTLVEPNSPDTLSAPTSIAKVDIEKNVISDLSEKFIKHALIVGRTLKGYHLGRDLDVPEKVRKDFFSNPEAYPNMGRLATVIQIVDKDGTVLGQRLTRLSSMYHISPQDWMMSVDPETFEGTTPGVDFSSTLQRKYVPSGVYAPSGGYTGTGVDIPVYRIQLAKPDKAYGYDPAKIDGPKKAAEFFEKYIEVLEMRHLLFRVFYFSVTEGDEWKNLDKAKMLLFGMVYSPEMRHKFKNNMYTKGSISRAIIDFAHSSPTMNKLFGEHFGRTEVPDMEAGDLLSERMYMEMLHHIGYISNADEFYQEIESGIEKLFKGK